MISIDKQQFSANLRLRLQQATHLPPLPETASKILTLRNNPEASLEQLVQIIEEDPMLTAFVMKYARMAIFGYSGRVTSVNHAISLVLGYTTALNVTMGIAASGCMKIPDHGPLGRIRLWSDALECAVLCRELGKSVSKAHKMDAGIIYLSGLLHNFGYMVFGHLCPNEFAGLNSLVSRYPEQDVRSIELQNFGITHDTIGLYLLKAWDLPEEVAIVAAEHHFPDYAGEHANYVKLVATANRLLSKEGMHDICDYIETGMLLDELGIDADKADQALAVVEASQSEFKKLALGLAA